MADAAQKQRQKLSDTNRTKAGKENHCLLQSRYESQKYFLASWMKRVSVERRSPGRHGASRTPCGESGKVNKIDTVK